jgi:hypothetical protein
MYKQITDDSLILSAKPATWQGATRPLYKQIVWENEYFKLGRVCSDNDCLLNSNKDLSTIEIGNNDYEDSLFINGWDGRESNTRWANSRKATLQLISEEYSGSIIIESLTLAEPQIMEIYIDELLVKRLPLSKDWKKQSIHLNETIPPGIHFITFKFSNLYVPDKILHNNDKRSLAAQFKLIKLEKK